MEVTVIRLNRPLLLLAEEQGEEHYYKTIYGFIVKERRDYLNPDDIMNYVGYLAGLHCFSNGDNYFTISCELRGVPDWADKEGNVHIRQDAWISSTQEMCRKKLNLSYDILTLDIEEDDLNSVINEDNLIVDETFYYDMRWFLPEKEQPLWKDDGLPF